MAKRAKKPSPTNPQRSGPVPGQLPRVVRWEDDSAPEPARPLDEGGLSLDDLGQAYAALLNRGAVPYEEPPIATVEIEDSLAAEIADPETPPAQQTEIQSDQRLPIPSDEHRTTDDPDAACDLSPRTILEALLFVGHPQNEPITARTVASFMRGVLPDEIDDHVRELNSAYAAENTPYSIVSEGEGYRLALREEFAGVRDHFYGKVREAKLSQGVIDTLAIVAYHQPIDVKKIDELRGKPSAALLSQLVRRQLLKIERSPDRPREALYVTTPRFLDLFGLDSLEDLPRGTEFDSFD